MQDIELVIAWYKEDIEWIEEYKQFKISIYKKEKDLPNRGREAGSYLHHIVTKYNYLSEYTYFLQGNPFEHWNLTPEFILQDLETNKILGGVLECNQFGKPHHGIPELPKVALDYGIVLPEHFRFITGAQFMIKKESILQYPLDFYQSLYNNTMSNDTMPYILERLWSFIFKIDLSKAELG